MKKLALIALLVFASCKKENCNCYRIADVIEDYNSVYAENTCSIGVKKYYVKSIDIHNYKYNDVVCNDVNFYQ